MESTPALVKQPLASKEEKMDLESRKILTLEELDRVPDGSQRGHKTNLYKMSTKDEILSVFRVGERVRLTKTIRNDGTYPHARTGDTLVEAGAEGYVRKIGDFLQTIRVYEVNFIEEGLTFGCREAELESALEDDGYDEVAEELQWLKEHRAQRAAEKLAQSQEEGE